MKYFYLFLTITLSILFAEWITKIINYAIGWPFVIEISLWLSHIF